MIQVGKYKKGKVIDAYATVATKFSIVLCILLCVMYVAIILVKQNMFDNILLSTKTIFEILLTICSIGLSIFATRISDNFTKECIESIDKIKEINKFVFEETQLKDEVGLIEKYFSDIQKKCKLCFRIFFIYILLAIIFSLIPHDDSSVILSSLSGLIGCVSSALSIYLAISSSLGCYASLRYIKLLLKLINDGINSLFDRCNDYIISDDIKKIKSLF